MILTCAIDSALSFDVQLSGSLNSDPLLGDGVRAISPSLDIDSRFSAPEFLVK